MVIYGNTQRFSVDYLFDSLGRKIITLKLLNLAVMSITEVDGTTQKLESEFII
ncbi:hypothetical protein HW132_12710 [Brasilonema sp. CT11]|nr:hypothetical protein [Brasilonema sp. CT11]